MIRINQEFLNYIEQLKKVNNSYTIQELNAEKGDKVLVQKKSVHAVYIIKSGLAKCYLTEDTGVDFIQEFFGEGEVFGELEMFSQNLSFCTIEALTPFCYYKIEKKNFLKLIQEDKIFNSLVLKLMAAKIKYTAIRHSYNQSHSIEQNLKRLTDAYPSLLNNIAKSDIANYLGITVRSLNRVISNCL